MFISRYSECMKTKKNEFYNKFWGVFNHVILKKLEIQHIRAWPLQRRYQALYNGRRSKYFHFKNIQQILPLLEPVKGNYSHVGTLQGERLGVLMKFTFTSFAKNYNMGQSIQEWTK